MTGLNVQAPWAYLLINGIKVVETRSYPLPKRYEGIELALIETPGKSRKFKARIIGTITFSHSFQYKNIDDWKFDYPRHRVDCTNPFYSWDENKPKYGWVVTNVRYFKKPVDPPQRRGIIFAKGCLI